MLRPGLTAIAAVLALTATPSLAQSAPSDAAAPMVTPPPVAAAPAPAPTAAPSVSAAPATSAAPAGGVVTAPVVGTVSPEVAAQVAAAKAAPAPEPTVTSTAADEPAPAPVRRTTTTRTETRTTRTAAPAEAAPSPTPAPVVAAPVVAPAPVAPAPVAKAAPAPTQTVDMDEALPIAGAAALGVLLIGGGAYAFARRRRNEDEVVYDEPYVEERMVAPAPAVATAAPMAGNVTAAPAFTAPLMAGDTQSGAHAVASAPSGPATTLPSGFDISRFGRHTQAAYRGPTPENPSLSLRKRLKVASFYDGRERMAREGKPVETFAPSAPIPAAAAERRTTDHITVRKPVARPRTGFRPVYQG